VSITIKDVHNAIRDVNIQGGHTEDIEAFLINSDDLHELIKQREQTPHGTVFTGNYDPDSFELLGVKIIQSPYTERGTIFKIMKNDQKQYAHPIDEMGNFVVPNQQYSPSVIGFLPTTGLKNLGTTADVTAESVKELTKALAIPKHLLFGDEADEKTETPKVEPEENKVVESRHSETRKIKLD